MAKQLLNRADIIAIFEQMGRERVAQGVATCRLGQPYFSCCFFDGPLQNRFV